MTALSAPGFSSNFSSTYSVVLDHPVDVIYPIMATSEGCERVTGLSSLCSHFELLERDTISIPASSILAESSVRESIATPTPEEGTRALPRQHFTLSETVPILGPLKKTVNIQGTLTWDDQAKTALYESVTGSILIWKLRIIKEEEGGTKTRVSERIEGSCPRLMQGIVASMTTKSHKEHMDSYHTLFKKGN